MLTEDYLKYHQYMKKLFYIYWSLLLNIVSCEITFSRMNIIKTKLRNNLTIPSLNYLMRISIEEEETIQHVDLTKVYQSWLELG